VRTSGYPFAKITRSGRLAGGLKFSVHASGTATITGKPSATGRYRLTLTAKNSLGSAKQVLTIIIR
jgi:hypothetical protein